MNYRAERLIGKNTLRGVKKVKAYTGMALTLMLLIAAASYRNGKPHLARKIERARNEPLKLPAEATNNQEKKRRRRSERRQKH